MGIDEGQKQAESIYPEFHVVKKKNFHVMHFGEGEIEEAAKRIPFSSHQRCFSGNHFCNAIWYL